jgi:hypothetical protein
VREYNPDKPTRTNIRAHRQLLDQLLSAGDILTARKIVDTHPYLRDYEEKIRQCMVELRQEQMKDIAPTPDPSHIALTSEPPNITVRHRRTEHE